MSKRDVSAGLEYFTLVGRHVFFFVCLFTYYFLLLSKVISQTCSFQMINLVELWRRRKTTSKQKRLVQMNKVESPFGGDHFGGREYYVLDFLQIFWGCRDGGTSQFYLLQRPRLVSRFWKRVKGEVHMQMCSLLQGSGSENSYLKQSSPKIKEAKMSRTRMWKVLLNATKSTQYIGAIWMSLGR